MQSGHGSRASRAGRLAGRWLAAVLITAVVALLAPSASYADVSPPGAAQPAAAMADGCRGITPAVLPAQGFIADPARGQGGHLWWRGAPDGAVTCIGTVVEFVHYTVPQAKTWQVTVYDAQDPDGQVVARQAFTETAGWWLFPFGVHRAFGGLRKVCLTATSAFGSSCISFPRPVG